MINPMAYCFYCMSKLPEENGVCPACGKSNRTRVNGQGELPFSQLAGKYIIGHALGRGGFGITYVGMNANLGTRVAIKEYFPADISERAPDGVHIQAVSRDVAPMFEQGKIKALQEAQTIARVESVPNVMRIYDCFGRNNTVYIIMEFIEGQTLSSLVAGSGPMPWSEVLPVIRPIGLTLDQLHRQNLIHRDVSPDNIMIRTDNGESVLLDFGAASAAIRKGEKHEKLLKDGYAAPEQYQEDADINGRADEYSLAATAFFMLTGTRPAGATQRKYGDSHIELPKKVRSSVPDQAWQALEKGMAVVQEDRYPTIGEMMEAINVTDGKRRSGSAGKIALIAAGVLAGVVAVGCILLGLLA